MKTAIVQSAQFGTHNLEVDTQGPVNAFALIMANDVHGAPATQDYVGGSGTIVHTFPAFSILTGQEQPAFVVQLDATTVVTARLKSLSINPNDAHVLDISIAFDWTSNYDIPPFYIHVKNLDESLPSWGQSAETINLLAGTNQHLLYTSSTYLGNGISMTHTQQDGKHFAIRLKSSDNTVTLNPTVYAPDTLPYYPYDDPSIT
jgi:hypothetical protein